MELKLGLDNEQRPNQLVHHDRNDFCILVHVEKFVNILTDQEMEELHAMHYGKSFLDYNRAIEAAILSKIGDPVAWRGVHGWMHTGVKISPTDTPLYRIPEVKE